MRRHLMRLSSFAAAVAAAASAPAVLAAAPDQDPRGVWDKGTWTWHTYGGYFNDLGPYDVEGGFGSVGVGYYFVDGMSLSAELTGYGISQPVANAVAAAPGVVFRHHLFDGGDSSLFIDVSAAPFFANERVPDEGTKFNFATQAGIGFTQFLGGNSHLLMGVRFFHLSNADMEGDDRNPSLNGISAYIGLLFKL